MDEKFQAQIRKGVSSAIKHYWETRARQRTRQGRKTGVKDAGLRSAVTGGAHLDGFVDLVRELLIKAGLKDVNIFTKKSDAVLPGFFRPTKNWDLLAVSGDTLVTTIEFKSQAGPSYGNNFNNRVEEALGNAVDFWKAYEKGVFKPSGRPFLGYIFLLEDDEASRSPVRAKSPHFKVLPEFEGAAYIERYRMFCERLVRERIYDAAGFITADRKSGLKGIYSEPSAELSFVRFAAELMSKAGAYKLLE